VPGEQALGFVGELHPLTARRYGFDDAVVCIELDLDRLCERLGDPPMALPLSEFPPLRQDIAVVVAEDVPAGRVVSVVRGSGGPELASVDVFDVYRGPPVPDGRKSVALHLVFQSSDRTLTDAEADTARSRIVAALASELGGELRE
jgi:phenylalanyl-tRNA synthetase beta chain